METIIVGIIVAAAFVFSIRSFVRIYKGEESCNCGSSCGSSTKGCCSRQIMDKQP